MKIIGLVICLMFIAPLCFAGEPVINHIVDLATGNNDFIETRIYGAVTVDLEEVPYLNVLNADLRIKLGTKIGDGAFRSGILETGLEWEF